MVIPIHLKSKRRECHCSSLNQECIRYNFESNDNETNRGREACSGADDTFVLPEERGQSCALPELPGAVGLRTGAAGSVPLWGGEADL